MRLGYCTHAMPTLTADEQIQTIAALGFDSVELTVRPGWRTELNTLDSAERRRIRGLLDRHGLHLPAIAGHASPIERDADEHRENWRRLIGAIDLCADLAGPDGPPALDTTIGGEFEDFEAARPFIVDRIGALVAHGERRGVVIATEPHVGSWLRTIDRVLWLLAAVPSPYHRLTFDVSHFNVQGVPFEESVAALAPHADFVHVKDERGVVPDYQFLIPGEGDFDYAGYLRAMARAGYGGVVCVEVAKMVQARPDFDPIAAARRSYDVLAAAFEAAGIPRARRRID